METLTSILQYYLNYNIVTIVHIIDYKLGLVPHDLYALLIHCLHREYRHCVSLSSLPKVIY